MGAKPLMKVEALPQQKERVEPKRIGLVPAPATNDDTAGVERATEVKHARWPLYLILTGLILSVAWTGLLGYGAVLLLIWLAD